MVKVILIMGGIVNEYRYRGLSMLKSKILRYSRKTGKVPEPGEPKYPETVYRVTVYGHTPAKVINAVNALHARVSGA